MDETVSALEAVVVIASLVSAVAAMVALALALVTVIQARAFRREERLQRLPELIEDAGDALLQITSHVRGGSAEGRPEWDYVIKPARLRAALAPIDEELPACRALARSSIPEGVESADPVRALTAEALDEVASLLARE